MYTKLFHRLPYLLCLFQITCFFALQRTPLHSSSFSDFSDEHKKIDVVCNSHSEELQIEPKNLGNELLVYGFIREFEPKVANKIIPDCIMNLCVGFSRRLFSCDCIKKKYLKLDIDKYRKKALMFFLIYKMPDQKEKSKKNIFHCACEEGHLGLVKLLRKWGVNTHATDADENNALHFACRFSGRIAMVNFLLDICKLGLETKGEYEKTPFLCAAQGGHLEVAKLLRKRDANIHARSGYENNALHYACLYSGSVEMVTWLLDVCELGLERETFHKRTPFLFAAAGNHLEVAKLLKKRGVNVNAKDEFGYNALHNACYDSGSVAMVTWLLDECKLGLETKGIDQKTPFLWAVKEEKFAIAKLLRQRGANIDAKDEEGSNALHYACLLGNIKMATWLLDECKLGLETEGAKHRQTPFLCAARKGRLGIAKLLKERGADIHAKNGYGENALHLACCHPGIEEMVNWLLDVCKIDIESKGWDQQTPFLCAAGLGPLGIVKLLRQRGANIHATDNNGNNALYHAKVQCSEAIINYLKDELKLVMSKDSSFP